MPLVIGLTGEKLSGKGTVSAYLAKKYKAQHYRFSKILEDIINRLYLPNTRQNQIDIALALRDKYGNEILAHVLKKDIENDKQEISVIDGIRYWEELHILKNLTGFVLINITAPLEIRHARALKRKEKEDEQNISFADFKKIEEGPTEVIIKELARDADYTVLNDKTFDDLYNAIDTIMTEIKK